MKSKAKLAFDLLEKEMEMITRDEQIKLKGGEGTKVEDPLGILKSYENYLKDQVSALTAVQDTGEVGFADAKKKMMDVYKDSLAEIEALYASENVYTISYSSNSGTSTGTSTGAPTGNGSTTLTGATTYDPDTNKVNAVVDGGSGTFANNVPLVAHEVHHLFQFESGKINRNDIYGSYGRSDEIESYDRQFALENGVDYFLNPDRYSRPSDAVDNGGYHFGESTGGSSGGSTGAFDGSTGVLFTGYDPQLGYFTNYYYYDVNGPYQPNSGLVANATGNYSTGFVYSSVDPNAPISTGNEGDAPSTGSTGG